MGKCPRGENMRTDEAVSIEDLYKRADDLKFKHFWDLDHEIRSMTIEWITENLQKRKTINRQRTVYGIKHVLQSQTGIYLTESQFAEALLICGFNVVKTLRLKNQMQTNVYERSPAFTCEWRMKAQW